MRPYRRYLFPAISVTLATAATLLLVEIAIRLFVPRPYWASHYEKHELRAHDTLGWANKPNLSAGYVNNFGYYTSIATNADGLQMTANTAATQGKGLRILLVGNSTVIGRDVRPEERIHTQLQQWLLKKGIEAEVLNAGVPGFATDQSLLFLQYLLPRYRPDIVLYGFCENDFYGITLDNDHGLHKPVFTVQGDSLVCHLPQQSNEAIKNVDSFWPESLWRRLLAQSATVRLLRPRLNAIRNRYFSAPDASLTAELRTQFYQLPDIWARYDTALLAKLVGQMQRSCQAYGARFAWYAHPAPEAVWNAHIAQTQNPALPYNRFAIEQCLGHIAARSHTQLLPNVNYFIKQQAEGPFHLLPTDAHCNGKGYQLQAQILGDTIMYWQKNDAQP